MIFMGWNTFEEYIDEGEIPISFLKRNPRIQSKDGDLPKGWYFCATDWGGGYIVKGGPNMTTEPRLYYTLEYLKGGQFMTVSEEFAPQPQTADWGHQDAYKYRLVSGSFGTSPRTLPALLRRRPLNWNLFPDVLIGDF